LNDQIRAHESWARTRDRSARTAPARAALLRKFELQVDPDGNMTPEARRLAAESARKGHMLRMTRASVEARRKAPRASRPGRGGRRRTRDHAGRGMTAAGSRRAAAEQASRIEAYVERVVAAAPDLSQEQRVSLAVLLRGIRPAATKPGGEAA
jgi:hypothetical protein